MYTERNFKSKKEVKAAIAAGEQIRVYNPGLGGPIQPNANVTLCGPHYPAPHKWYGQGKLENGILVSIR